MTIDWNFVLQVLDVQAGSTLAFDGIVSKSEGCCWACRADGSLRMISCAACQGMCSPWSYKAHGQLVLCCRPVGCSAAHLLPRLPMSHALQ